jgi:hypothetical protein
MSSILTAAIFLTRTGRAKKRAKPRAAWGLTSVTVDVKVVGTATHNEGGTLGSQPRQRKEVVPTSQASVLSGGVSKGLHFLVSLPLPSLTI